MTLFLSNNEIASMLTMEDTLSAVEEAYKELGKNIAVNRPRSDLFSPQENSESYHIFKTMEGSLPTKKVVALRIGSNIVRWRKVHGFIRKEGVRCGLEGKFLGLILLFSTVTGELLAILHDSYIQKMRVGATNGLAAKFLAKENARSIGLLGSGWQASAQIKAFKVVRPINKVLVYSPNAEHREKFAANMSRELEIDVYPVTSPDVTVSDADILACATNSIEPVINSRWLTAGMFLSSVKFAELGADVLEKCDRVVVNTHLGDPENYLPKYGKVIMHDPFDLLGGKINEIKEKDLNRWNIFPQLQELLGGIVRGRENEKEITCFVNNIGLGIQFTAVANLVYELAKERGLGREIDGDIFLQE